jgi:hypothetical protein
MLLMLLMLRGPVRVRLLLRMALLLRRILRRILGRVLRRIRLGMLAVLRRHIAAARRVVRVVLMRHPNVAFVPSTLGTSSPLKTVTTRSLWPSPISYLSMPLLSFAASSRAAFLNQLQHCQAALLREPEGCFSMFPCSPQIFLQHARARPTASQRVAVAVAVTSFRNFLDLMERVACRLARRAP